MNTNLKLTSAIALLSLSMSAQANFVDLFLDPPGIPGAGGTEEGGQQVSDTTLGDGGEFLQYPGAMEPASGSILGGYRDLYVEVISRTEVAATEATLSVASDPTTPQDPNSGRLSFSSNDNTVGLGVVQWDGNDNSAELSFDQMSENLVDQAGCPVTGCDFFQFTAYASDLGPWAFEIGVWTSETQFTNFILPATVVGPGDDPFVRTLDFLSFTSDTDCNSVSPIDPTIIKKQCGADGTADMSSVVAMQLILNTPVFGTPAAGLTSIDLRIGAITKDGNVPEPGILALMGLGLAASGLARRKKSKA